MVLASEEARKLRETHVIRAVTDPERIGAWDVLEDFLGRLQSCLQTDDQIRALLEAVRESTRADAVFWFPGSTYESFAISGSDTLTAENCSRLVRDLTHGMPPQEAEKLWAPSPPTAALAPYSVSSAAMMRISKSHGSWVVALLLDCERHFDRSDLKVMALARRMLINQRQQAQTYERLKDTLFGLIRCLTTTIDARDPYTQLHSDRVARIAVRLGLQMGLPGSIQSDLRLAGMLHDIGKIGVRDSVLLKPGSLTEEEIAHIREHTVIGDHILSNIKQLAHLRPGVRNHHEHYDGTGYPDGLRGEEIPLLARVLAVADACDAMMSARPYRPPMAREEIDSVLSDGAGTQWDPRVVECFLDCRHDLYTICQQSMGQSVYKAVERSLANNKDTSGSMPAMRRHSGESSRKRSLLHKR
jgi:HD-GYP domain-containing protein (c-di-GMP phosphodiesterase class II)